MNRAALLLFAFCVTALAGCHIFSPSLPCGDDGACAAGESCVDGFCALVLDADGEGEGDVAEGEGDVVVGEGEGDVVSEGEGEGDGVKGEGEGEVVVVGEGEGDVIIVGEGEGEPPPPPPDCTPIVDEKFNNGSLGYFDTIELEPGTSVGVVGGDALVRAEARTGATSFVNVLGPPANFVNTVIVVEVALPVAIDTAVSDATVGFQLYGLPNAGVIDIGFDVFDSFARLYAQPVVGDTVVGDVVTRGAPDMVVEVRLDAVNPVLVVNGGAPVTLPFADATSDHFTDHQLGLFAGCFDTCPTTTLLVHRVRVLPAGCRP